MNSNDEKKIIIFDDPRVNAILNDLNTLELEELIKKYKYTEAKVRHTLMFLLVVTSGKQGDALKNLKIGEIMGAKKTKNGLMVATSKEQKTAPPYGPALITFHTEEPYLACVGFITAFR